MKITYFNCLYNFYLEYLSFWEEMSEVWSRIFIGLNVKYAANFPILMQLEFSRKIFEKYSNIKLHENRPVGAELFNADRQIGMAKLIVAFRNFANARITTMNAEDGYTDDVLQCACPSLPILFFALFLAVTSLETQQFVCHVTKRRCLRAHCFHSQDLGHRIVCY